MTRPYVQPYDSDWLNNNEMKPRKPAKPETEKTTINLPKDLKLAANLHAVKTGQDLQDLIAEGLRLVLGRKGER